MTDGLATSVAANTTAIATKMNNSTGATSTSINNSAGSEVAVFYNNATKDVELKGRCFVSSGLSVLGISVLSNTMNVSAQQAGGGTIRVNPWGNGSEASIGCYSYTDSRAVAAGDMWVAGGNSWARKDNSFSFGTLGEGIC